jgi:ABC-type multidrug transport system fused ATPase/permease subunit
MRGLHKGYRSPKPSDPTSPPASRQERTNSRKAFRRFLREHGIFGVRRKKEEEEPSPSSEADTDPQAEGSGRDEDQESGATEEKKSVRVYMGRYLRALKGQRRRILVMIGLMVVSLGLRAVMPFSPKIMIDYVLPRRDWDLLLAACGGLLIVGIAQVGIELTQDILSRSVLGTFVANTRRKLMKHLQFLPLARLQELKVGGVVSRLQGDTEAMAGLLHQGLLTPLNAILTFTIAAGSLFYLNWRVALVCLGMSALIIVAAYIYFNKMRPYWKALREEIAAIGGQTTEVFSGIPVVRAFGRERSEARNYGLGIHLLWRKTLHGNILSAAVHRSVYTVFWLINIAIWLYGGYEYLQGRMTTGDLFTFIAFVGWFFQPIFMIMFSLTQMQNSIACAERVFDLLDEPEDMVDAPDAKPIDRIRDRVRFEHVTFEYPDGTRALEDVSFTIEQGKVTALVGPSGAGKSTVTNLVMRFYDVTDGAVLVDGTDLRDLKLSDYRKLLSLVLQEVFLFDGTARENIAYALPGASQEAIESAAKVAHCHEFVTDLENGYDTVIGERGVKLSGGQKQRLALARAILADPQLLVLDEATSNLDSESEALIQDALRAIFEERTTLVIAHRLSTIMDADTIIVLDHGRVVEQGTHAELLKAGGRYAELYHRQMEKAEQVKQVFDWDTGEDNAGDN